SRTFTGPRSTRAAMDADDDRPWTGEARGRSIENAGNHQAVETLPADDFRLWQCVRVERTELTLGPSIDTAGSRVDGEHIAKRSQRGKRDRHRAAVGPPHRRAREELPGGQFRGPAKLEGARVEELHPAARGAVEHRRDGSTIGGKREGFQIVRFAG